MRLTNTVRQQILNQNEGFTTRTSYDARNSSEERIYTISGGMLHIRAVGKTSWADSRYDKDWIASDEETHSFLYAHKWEMNLDGIE